MARFWSIWYDVLFSQKKFNLVPLKEIRWHNSRFSVTLFIRNAKFWNVYTALLILLSPPPSFISIISQTWLARRLSQSFIYLFYTFHLENEPPRPPFLIVERRVVWRNNYLLPRSWNVDWTEGNSFFIYLNLYLESIF